MKKILILSMFFAFQTQAATSADCQIALADNQTGKIVSGPDRLLPVDFDTVAKILNPTEIAVVDFKGGRLNFGIRTFAYINGAIQYQKLVFQTDAPLVTNSPYRMSALSSITGLSHRLECRFSKY